MFTSNNTRKQFRRSLRLQGYDYAQAGAYFITSCTQQRVCLFGNIVDSAMVLNDAGQMIKHWWNRLARKFPSVVIDTFVIMTNYMHGIITIGEHNENDDSIEGGHMGPPLRTADNDAIANNDDRHAGVDPRVHPHRIPFETNDPHRVPDDTPSLPTIIQWFKTMTTNTYIRGVRDHGWTAFAGKLWQRSYYEHIIRNEHELNDTRDYINTNPLRWTMHQ